MKNSKGFVSISGLIVLLISISILAMARKSITNRYELLDLKNQSVENSRILNNRILLVLHQEEYFGELLADINRNFRKKSYIGLHGNIRLREDILGQKEFVFWSNASTIDQNIIYLETSIKRNKVSNKMIYQLSLINPIFLSNQEKDINYEDIKYIDENILDRYKDWEYYNEGLEYFVDGQPSNYLRSLEDSVYIENDENKKYFNSRAIYLIIKNDDGKANLIIEDDNDFHKENLSKDISLDGIIYVDGNLYIKKNMEFKGLVIVRGRIFIDENAHLDLDGYLKAREIDGSYKYTYNRGSFFWEYGTYIPGFIHLKLQNIRSGQ